MQPQYHCVHKSQKYLGKIKVAKDFKVGIIVDQPDGKK